MRKTKVISSWLFLFVGLVFFSAGCVSSGDATPEATPIMVWEYENRTAFDTVYPEGWDVSLIREGFLVFSPPEVAYESVAGPTMSILRTGALEGPGTVKEELDHFLEFGPLREDYVLISSINPVKIGQYDGLEVAVEREATEMFLAMKSVISVVKTDSGSLYTFVATAPTDQWDENWPLLLSISQNISFNE
jgi:hypothetical protein